MAERGDEEEVARDEEIFNNHIIKSISNGNF
jgi:hypothetical protein